MARSHSIYVVFIGEVLYSAFTVKHELMTSLPKTYEEFKNNNYSVYRLPDNGTKCNTVPVLVNMIDEIKKHYENSN